MNISSTPSSSRSTVLANTRRAKLALPGARARVGPKQIAVAIGLATAAWWGVAHARRGDSDCSGKEAW